MFNFLKSRLVAKKSVANTTNRPVVASNQKRGSYSYRESTYVSRNDPSYYEDTSDDLLNTMVMVSAIESISNDSSPSYVDDTPSFSGGGGDFGGGGSSGSWDSGSSYDSSSGYDSGSSSFD